MTDDHAAAAWQRIRDNLVARNLLRFDAVDEDELRDIVAESCAEIDLAIANAAKVKPVENVMALVDVTRIEAGKPEAGIGRIRLTSNDLKKYDMHLNLEPHQEFVIHQHEGRWRLAVRT